MLGWLCCSSRAMNAAAGSGGGTPLERAAIAVSSVTQQMDMHFSDSLAALLLASQLQRCRRMLALEVLHLKAESVCCLRACNTACSAFCIRQWCL